MATFLVNIHNEEPEIIRADGYFVSITNSMTVTFWNRDTTDLIATYTNVKSVRKAEDNPLPNTPNMRLTNTEYPLRWRAFDPLNGEF